MSQAVGKKNVKKAVSPQLRGGNGLVAVRKRSARTRSVRTQHCPLPFYSVVTVRRISSVPTEVRGRHGVVVGRAQDKQGAWKYSVAIKKIEEAYYLPHGALTPTGEVLRREDLYKGETMRVCVDGEGRGRRATA